MNDLTEKALHALNVAQAEVRSHPVISLASSGFVVSCVVVYAGGRAAAARATEPATSWFGLLHSATDGRIDNVAGAVTVVGLVFLVLLWIAAVFALRTPKQPESRVWMVSAAWATPFVLGPPIMDSHVWLDVARGLVQRAGGDPYSGPINQLTRSPVLGAIDPQLRGLPSGTGPFGTLIQHLAVSASGGHIVGAAIVLRAASVVALIALGRSALDLAGSRRSDALALTVLNPLLLVYGVAAVHLDLLAAAFTVTALAAANQRRWIRAIVLATLGGLIVPPLLLVVPVIVAVHVRGRRGGSAWLVAGRDIGEAAALVALLGFGVTSGFDWARNADDQFPDYTPFAPANVIGKILRPFVEGASFDDLAAGGRLTAIIAIATAVIYLSVTARHRPVDISAGYALLAVAVLAPDVWPWFLIWPMACLAPNASGMRRTMVVLLSATATLLDPPGFSDEVSRRLGVVAVCTAGAVLALVLWREREPDDRRRVSAASPPSARRARAPR